MAKITKWSFSSNWIQWGSSSLERISTDTALMDMDVQCFHCGKNIKSGKLVFVGGMLGPHHLGEDDWGNGYRKTFCSSSHIRLYAKNNKGLD